MPSSCCGAPLAIQEKALGPEHSRAGRHPQHPRPPVPQPSQVRRGRSPSSNARSRSRRRSSGPRQSAKRPSCSTTSPSSTASSGDSANALAYSRKATASVIAHASAEATGAALRESAGGLVEQRSDYFLRHVNNLAEAIQKRLEPEAELRREAFVMAQWAKQSAAATAIQQMGLRFAGRH